MDYGNSMLPAVKEVNEDSIFIWIDILGFSKELEKRDDYQTLKQVLLSFRESFQMPIAHQAVISDGILLEIPYSKHHWDVAEIKRIFSDIAQKQLNFMLKQKRVVRGGIAHGLPIFKTKQKLAEAQDKQDEHNEFDKDRMYISDGLAKAYRIESKNSNWPIIGITEEELSEFRNKTKTANEDFGLRITYNESGKKILFLHFAETLKPSQTIDSNVLELKWLIEEKLNPKNSIDERTRAKYFWILKYLKVTLGTNILDEYKEHIL